MTKLVRGGVILSLVGLFVLVFDGTAETGYALSIANSSQTQLDSSFDNTNITAVETEIDQVQDTNKAGKVEQDKGNKVEKTVSTRAVGMSRGAFSATAYCLKGRTAMGHGVRKGIIAADPRVLPLGSRISLDGGYGGTYLVSDTGGRIKAKSSISGWQAVLKQDVLAAGQYR